MKRTVFITLLLALVLPLNARHFADALKRNPAAAAGVMAPYTFEEVSDTPPPTGYKPFYISHYARHGSRYHLPYMIKRCIPAEMIEARKAGTLTPAGEAALDRMLEVIALHDGTDGDLTEVGAAQHSELAKRMYFRFKGVFRKGGSIRCRSSIVPRCIASMASFGTTLQKCNSSLDISYGAGQRDYDAICKPIIDLRLSHIYLDSLDRVRRPLLFDPSRLLAEFFVPGYQVKDPQSLFSSIYQLGSVEPALGREPYIFSLFSDEELYTQWQLYNDWIYGDMANSEELGFRILASARPLLEEIVSLADEAISGNGPLAELRFGHDGSLLPLLCRMGLEGVAGRYPIEKASEHWAAHEGIPCAANLQLVFYRNRKGSVLVKLLYNEQERLIPSLKPVSGPYYDWNELKQYWAEPEI